MSTNQDKDSKLKNYKDEFDENPMILEDMDDYPSIKKSPKKSEDIDMSLIIKTFERKASLGKH